MNKKIPIPSFFEVPSSGGLTALCFCFFLILCITLGFLDL